MPMRVSAVLPVLAFLGACAVPTGQVEPVSLRLGDESLTLRLSDGTVCTKGWATEPVGRLDGCGPGYGYAVQVEENPNILRQLAEGLVLALGGKGILAPMAEVVITDPAGTDWVFTSPQPVE
jgi:hypothetical protein